MKVTRGGRSLRRSASPALQSSSRKVQQRICSAMLREGDDRRAATCAGAIACVAAA
jgi:hypothetical protein